MAKTIIFIFLILLTSKVVGAQNIYGVMLELPPDKACNDIPLGIEDNSFPLVVYPNPAQGFVTINSAKVIDQVKIYDLNGKFMIEQTPLSQVCKIDLKFLKDGLYVLQMKCGREMYHRKLIVRK